MKLASLVLGLLLHLGFLGEGVAYNDRIMSPVQVLERSVLEKQITLKNSPKIYEEIANLFSLPGLVSGPHAGLESNGGGASIVWLADADLDKKEFTLTFEVETSIYDIIEAFADRRGEGVSDFTNYLIIYPLKKSAQHEVFIYTNRSSLSKMQEAPWKDVNLYQLTTFFQPEGAAMEEFINMRIKDRQKELKLPAALIFHMDDKAKATVEGINLIGLWEYSSMLDAICCLTGLKWEVTGSELWLRGR